MNLSLQETFTKENITHATNESNVTETNITEGKQEENVNESINQTADAEVDTNQTNQSDNTADNTTSSWYYIVNTMTASITSSSLINYIALILII